MQMETIVSNEREEGEIIDDELESISDDSIIATPKFGKCYLHKESLRPLSLSSVSDLEVEECLPRPNMKKRHRRRSTLPSKARRVTKHYHSCRSRSDSSSDCDDGLEMRKRLLQKAIVIDSKESLNNSLRTRLRGMVTEPVSVEDISKKEPNEIANNNCTLPSSIITIDDISAVDSPKSVGAESKESQDNDLDQDNELIQLRLEALKTAVINKFEHRKRRKLNEDVEKSNCQETNKENSSDNVNSDKTNSTAVSSEPSGAALIASGEDEDEDILRAVLLASIAKKITTKPKTSSVIYSDHAQKSSSSYIQVKDKTDSDTSKIPRFIISVNNSDSDSDYDMRENIKKDKKVDRFDIQKEVENEVEKFLKQQRAEVEAKQKPSLAVSNVKTQSTLKFNKTNFKETNDLYKLLPKSKQLEYEKLIQRLKSAEKKPRIRRLSSKLDSKHTKTKNTVKNLETISNVECRTQGRNNVTGNLQRTWKHVQSQVNGRLQIKGKKYHSLSSLMKRLNEVSLQQRKHEIQIKNLLNQLKEAKTQSQKTQQIFHDLLKEFLSKKEEIDSRQFKDSAIPQPSVGPPKTEIVDKLLPVNDTQAPVACKPQKIQSNLNCKVVLEQCPITSSKSKDIELKQIGIVESIMTRYTSPLNAKESASNINPLEILCPFEMNGFCRDKECTYNHYK